MEILDSLFRARVRDGPAAGYSPTLKKRPWLAPSRLPRTLDAGVGG